MNSATRHYKQASETVDRDQLIVDHIEYARKIFGTLAIDIRDEDQRENLYSAAMVGLIQAANKYDPASEASFRTFSYSRIRGAVLDELRKNSSIPQETLKNIKKINDVYERLEPPVALETLVKQTGLTIQKITLCLEAMRFLHPSELIDMNCSVHSSWNHNQYSPEYLIQRSEMKQILADGIETLPDKERITLTLYYTEELTLDEIGQVLELSESRISKLLAKAKFRMQEYIRSRTS